MDQRVRDLQRDYLDFLDDEVSILPIFFFNTSYNEPESRVERL